MDPFTLLTIPDFTDERGSLFVVDKLLPFEIKRVFYIVNANHLRGGHRHHQTRQAMICLKGSVDVYLNNGTHEQTITLSSAKQCLMIEPADWHTMDHFSADAVVLVFASAHYDKSDYIMEPYA